ncbi:hypothetical protein O7626_08275 [Micromonospora sp. WMMD1102]|uniref:hypothetical protein n=1 Tax=Micromonospora sp. WMMD1102 TaxID=3016105 RepID=UPI00241570C0|nr:hypothetical protein [Micromonospora sp. WMMD1102]MDG4785922.1 hypothetical protein [Micromonospora sp. WMMD1102]
MTVDFSPGLASISTFRDAEACERARRIPRSRITEHPNPDFRIRVIEDPSEFYQAFAADLVGEIRRSRDAGQGLVLILPVGPVPQFEIAARQINRERLSLAHVTTFNMDEYADSSGTTAPISWAGSFQRAMWDSFFSRIDEELRPPETQIHFPTSEVVADYSTMVEDAGGADVVYGGIGWGGHIAFWEPHLADEFRDDPAGYRAAGARTVELHPITIMQNALHSFGGDWSWVPPFACTIGPREILGARRRSFWLDGDLGNGYSWQRFIARLVAHGPVTEHVPGSLLQEAGADYALLGSVADDLVISMA